MWQFSFGVVHVNADICIRYTLVPDEIGRQNAGDILRCILMKENFHFWSISHLIVNRKGVSIISDNDLALKDYKLYW